MTQVKFKALGILLGLDHEMRISAGRHGDASAERDSARHYEALVIIRVFSNQIHAPGCAEDCGGRLSKQPSEPLGHRCGFQLRFHTKPLAAPQYGPERM